MIEFHKQTQIPRWYILSSSAWSERPEGFYFIPEGEFIDGSTRHYGPFVSEDAAKEAGDRWEKSWK